jgi:hypothetical protein
MKLRSNARTCPKGRRLASQELAIRGGTEDRLGYRERDQLGVGLPSPAVPSEGSPASQRTRRLRYEGFQRCCHLVF